MKVRDVLRTAGALALLAIAALVIPAAAAAEPVTLTINPPTHSIVTAHLSGEVKVPADGFETYWCLEYAEKNVGNWSGFCYQGPVQPGESKEVETDLSGLKAGTPYEVRLAALNFTESIEEHSAVETFTTDPAVAPTLTLGPAEDITSNSAHLSGTIDPEGGNEDAVAGLLPISWELQYCSSGCSEPGNWQAANPTSSNDPLENAAAESDSAITVEADATLIPHQVYKFRLVAHYAGLQAATPENQQGEFSTVAIKPDIDREALWEPKQTSIRLNALVNPHNNELTDCHFVYGIGSPSGHEAPCEGVDEVQQVEVVATSGEFRLVFGGETTGDIAYNAPPGVVQAELEALTSIGNGQVQVVGGPTNDAVTYVITFKGALGSQNVEQLQGLNGTEPVSEIGILTSTQGMSGLEAFNANLGEGYQRVTAHISDLTPGAEYSFRLVAENGAGVEEGAVRTFTSLKESQPENCPNQSLREQQGTAQLPGCRAFELVTPQEKGNSDIVANNSAVIAAKDGDAAAYMSHTAFGDVIGAGVSGTLQYIARRGAAGWSSLGITPAPRPETYQTFFGPTIYTGFSDDLRRAMLFGYDLPEASGAIPERVNIYSEDTESRALSSVTGVRDGYPQTLPSPIDLRSATRWGLSADGRHLSFVAFAKFLANAAPGPFTPNVYQWDDGALSLVGILPDGEVPEGGSTVPGNNTNNSLELRWTMSSDGSRQLFLASPNQPGGVPSQIYQRIDGNRTVWVSESENPAEPETPAAGLRLWYATPDGRTVFFTTSSKLLPADNNESGDLYRWRDTPHPASESNLTLVEGFNGGGYGQVVGGSDDGSRIYYTTTGEALDLWDEGEVRAVAQGGVLEADPARSAAGVEPGAARVTPNGRFISFVRNNNGGRPQLWLYDARNDTLACVSCPPGPPASPCAQCVWNAEIFEGLISPAATRPIVGVTYQGSRPRFLAADGRVFFSTVDPLVPGDTNGVPDVYEYDPATGQTSILSLGTGKEVVSFADASADGKNVFIATRNQLLGADTDDFVDLYDVRSGGGFPEPPVPPPAPCQGEGCQGAAAAPPAVISPSSGAVGKGNPRPVRPRCVHKRKKAGGRKKPCHRHRRGRGKRHHTKRTVSGDRRVGK